MQTVMMRIVRATVLPVAVLGSLTAGPAASAQEDTGRAGAAVSCGPAASTLLEELLWTDEVFDRATPGSPAQFRARESADALRTKISGTGGR